MNFQDEDDDEEEEDSSYLPVVESTLEEVYSSYIYLGTIIRIVGHTNKS